ncbi:MAG: HlyD family efflux transporter periplasmic adaptor subunit [Rubripirellula sp.]|nr:HlyD family efflux transporter periplasmic adaptor subunit [Rubripirellula sp.]
MQNRRQRPGFFQSTLVVCITASIAAVLLMRFAGTPGEKPLSFFSEDPEFDLLTTTAQIAAFEHVVVERGELQSSSNVEVRCLVKGRTSSSAVNILEIVPEGTWVEEGDFLVKLDDAALQKQLIQQQITCSTSESAAIEAEADLESAKLALHEYAEGTYVEDLAKQQSEVFVAEENLRRAEEYLQYSNRLAERGYIPDAQLDADQFALEKAKKELGVAKTKLEVLSKFTKEKMLTQLEAKIQTATAKLRSRQKTLELENKELAEIEEQIALCRITAPVQGQVVYEQNRRSTSTTILIEEGAPVRERQVIINLPDPSKMKVIAKVHESRIGFITKGQVAELRLDSLLDVPLTGTVVEVSEYPLPPISVYMSHVKEYEVSIRIDNPPLDLRPGMTAEAKILVDRMDDVLQLPIEAIQERDDKFYCAIPIDDGSIETRELKVGKANETSLVVESGIQVGEEVILNISDEGILEQMDFPEISTL